MNHRIYGNREPTIIAVHGGPGAAGELVPLAEALSGSFSVIESLQRRSTPESTLSVHDHIIDLQDLIASLPKKPILLGHSWGAMLSLAYACEYPDSAAAIVLIGCGTFDESTRKILQANLDRRLSPEQKELMQGELSTDEDLAKMGELMSIYSYELDSTPLPEITADAKGHHETWSDMVRLQNEGRYPNSFSAIECPIVLIQGDIDPHPGAAIRDSLLPYIPQLEYEELGKCGHYPWFERHAKEYFIEFVISWIESRYQDVEMGSE